MIRDKLGSLMTSTEQFTGLILLSGVDRPGISEALFSTLSPFSISILDIEQVVISNRLILTVLIALNPAHEQAIEADLMQCAHDYDVDIATLFSIAHGESMATKKALTHVIISSKKLLPSAIAGVCESVNQLHGNIERVTRTSSSPNTVVEFVVSGIDHKTVSHALKPVADEHGVNISVHPGGFSHFSRRLVQLDVDSTLIQQEVIDLLAEKAGVGVQVKAITESAMRGELDFEQSLRARVRLLKGLPESVLVQVQSEILLTPGAKSLVDTLHTLGHSVAVVSGGFINVIEPLLKSLNIKHYKANTLEILDGVLTGDVIGVIIDKQAKADALREFASIESIHMDQTVAIGDGANDLEMIAAAGLGIAFNAKPAVIAAADSSITEPSLESVLNLLGIPHEDSGD